MEEEEKGKGVLENVVMNLAAGQNSRLPTPANAVIAAALCGFVE